MAREGISQCLHRGFRHLLCQLPWSSQCCVLRALPGWRPGSGCKEAIVLISLIHHTASHKHQSLLCKSDLGFLGSCYENRLCLAHPQPSHSEVKQTRLVLHLICMASYTFAWVHLDSTFSCYISFVLLGIIQPKITSGFMSTQKAVSLGFLGFVSPILSLFGS